MKKKFKSDLKELDNADLIYLLKEMKKNRMHGAVHEVRREMVRRFCQTHWSYLEELAQEAERDG